MSETEDQIVWLKIMFVLILEIPCLEKHCIYAASEILKSIDDKIDP